MKRNLAVIVVIVGIIAIVVSWLMLKGDNGVSIQVVRRYEFARVQEPLYYLIQEGGSLEEISQQVSSRPEVVHTFTDQGITLLGWAAAENRLDIIRMLVEKGADMNAGAGTGTPPIHCAVIYRQYAAAALLIELGADPVSCLTVQVESFGVVL